MPLADPALRWAIRIVDTALAVPVYRSGPLGFLPGGPRSRIFGDRIRIHRGGGNLGLDAPDGAPQVLIDFVRDNLPHGVRSSGHRRRGRPAGPLRPDVPGPLPAAAGGVGRPRVPPRVRHRAGHRPGPAAPRGGRVAAGARHGRPAGAAARHRRARRGAGRGRRGADVGDGLPHRLAHAAGGGRHRPDARRRCRSPPSRSAESGSEVDATVALVSGAVNGGIRVFEPVPVVFEPTA